jgi:TetR/AcrR family tetracycline transcriptional repressor
VISRRTQPDGLSRTAVVERALALADAEGLDAVTIRRLGQEFGVTPMALYWHVKNKDELLDAMGDALSAGLTYDTSPGLAWDDALAAVMRGLVAAMRIHPTCTELVFRRVFACPESLRAAEYLYGVLLAAGFSKRQTADIAVHALQTAAMLVRSQPGAEPGRSAEEFAGVMAYKRGVLDALPAAEFPNIHELADEILDCDDADGYYAMGVDVFVAGVRAMHERNRTPVS